MDLTKYTGPQFIREILAADKYAAIAELAGVFESSGICDHMDILIEALTARENIMTTGIGFEIAVPHARIKQVNRIAFAIGISKNGIDFDAMDKKPARILIMVVAGALQHNEYLRLLSWILNTLKKEGTVDRLMNAASSQEIIDLLQHRTSP